MSSAAVVERDTPRKHRGGKPGRVVRCRWHSWCQLPTCEGRMSRCKDCKAAYMRSWRPTHAELDPETRRRLNCRAYTNCYQRRGVWPAGPCEVCGTDERVENHHYAGYDRPDRYRRLCRRHHRELHRQEAQPCRA